MGLSKTSVNRPVTTLMLMLIVCAFGIISFTRLPLDLFPKMELPMQIVMVTYPNAAPSEVETMVTKPIEQQVATVESLSGMTSYSMDGTSLVIAQFESGTDMNFAGLNIREKVELVSEYLPGTATKPMVIAMNPDMLPIAEIYASSNIDLTQLNALVKDDIIPAFERVEGVASVSSYGGKSDEIAVDVDQSKLDGYHLTLMQVQQALAAENISLPSGDVKKGSRDMIVRTVGEFDAVDDVKNVSMLIPTGEIVHIGDIAEVVRREKAQTTIGRVDGKPAIGISISKQTVANTVQVADRLNVVMDDLEKRFPNIKFTKATDQSEFVRNSISFVAESAIMGCILAILICLFFLRSLAATMIIAISIPTSIVATFILMYFAGFTMNMLSLSGLAVGIGMLVDDSIVVMENVFRRRGMGLSARDSAIVGTGEVTMPVFAATMTKIAVFLPIVFVEGIAATIFKEFSFTICFALAASLIVSLTVIPMLCSRMIKIGDLSELGDPDLGGADLKAHPGKEYTGEGSIRMDNRAVFPAETTTVNSNGLANTTAGTTASGFVPNGTPTTADGVVANGIGTKTFATTVDGTGANGGGVWTDWTAALPAKATNTAQPAKDAGPARPTKPAKSTSPAQNARPARPGQPQRTTAPTRPARPAKKKAASKARNSGGGNGRPPRPPREPRQNRNPGIAILSAFGKAIDGVIDSYVKVIRFALIHRKTIVALSVALLMTSATLIMVVGGELIPSADEGSFTISAEVPYGTPIEKTDEIMKEVENYVAHDVEGLKDYSLGIGNTSIMSIGQGSNTATLTVNIVDKSERDFTTEDVVKKTQRDLSDIAGVKISVAAASSMNMSMSSGGAPVNIRITGDDFDELNRISDDLVQMVKGISGTTGVKSSLQEGSPEVRIIPRRQIAAAYGVSAYQIAQSLKSALSGATATNLKESGSDTPIVVSLNGEYSESLENMENLPMMTPTGQTVTVGDVASVQLSNSPSEIRHTDQKRVVTVTAELDGRDLQSVTNDVTAALGKYDMPQGYNYDMSGEAQEMTDSFTQLIYALLLSLVIVYMILASQFESFVQPFIIMLAIPFALTGAFIGLFITNTPLSLVAFIGIIMLAGIVVNNSILLIDFINKNRQVYDSQTEAIVAAGRYRFRPIIMTMFTTSLGLLPLAIGLGNGAELTQSMGITVIGGLLFSTVVTLVLIPVIYAYVDDANEKIKRRKKARNTEEPVVAPVVPG